MEAAPALHLSKLIIGNAGKAIAGPLDLDLWGGGLVALTGPNGTGKSTLLRTLLGLIPAISGEISIAADSPPGYVPQAPPNFTGLPVNVSDVIRMGMRNVGSRTAVHDRAAAALSAVGLPGFERRMFDQLSGGEQKRIMLARSLAARSTVICMDEPTAQVDAEACSRIWTLLRQLAIEGRIVLVATHDLFHAPEYASRVLVLNEGRITEAPTPWKASSQPSN
ncbi:MAG TPA: ATP-binding cassette domain-containing protein [Planctomycetota bacterium]|jgi:ABC-type Mn2+/Zn2+ transport system ATPase subunit|nr:ATP-binding cassette domain-containing protein [Planctomycetota bacterium]